MKYRYSVGIVIIFGILSIISTFITMIFSINADNTGGEKALVIVPAILSIIFLIALLSVLHGVLDHEERLLEKESEIKSLKERIIKIEKHNGIEFVEKAFIEEKKQGTPLDSLDWTNHSSKFEAERVRYFSGKRAASFTFMNAEIKGTLRISDHNEFLIFELSYEQNSGAIKLFNSLEIGMELTFQLKNKKAIGNIVEIKNNRILLK